MAQISEELTLVDNFSGTFNKFIEGFRQIEGETVTVSATTQDLVNQLQVYEQAVVHAFTENQQEEALKRLEKQMNNVGLAFTNAEQEANAAALLMSDGLQELANQGAIAANYMAEFAAAEQNTSEATDETSEKQSKLLGILSAVGGAAGAAVKSMMGFKDVQNPLDGVINKLTRMVVYFFSVRKLISYIKDALKRTPDEIASSFTTLKTTIGDSFARVVVSAIGAMQKGIDRLNQAFQSDAGQKFFRGLEAAAAVAGQVVSFLAEILAGFIEFMGNNFQTVITAACVALGVYAAKMIVAAISSMIANWQIWLIVAAVAGLILILNKCGISTAQIFGFIAKGLGRLVAMIWNKVAVVWDIVASLAEFLANVFTHPIEAIVGLLYNLYDIVLSVMENIAGMIDAVFGSSLQKTVARWRDEAKKEAKEFIGDNYIYIPRMGKMDVKDTGDLWGDATENFLNGFSDFSLSNMMPTAIKDLDNTDKNVASIKKSVSAADEDIKSLVDLAERRYVAQVNLTSQTPVINVTGQNTGNTAADRKSLADALAEILVEQTAAGSTLSTAAAIG